MAKLLSQAWCLLYSFVRHSEKQTVLKTNAGREINTLIEKLSKADRELLPALQDDPGNSFE